MTIRILLADDQALVRAGLRAILGAMPDVEVVAEAANGAEALRLARELAPDIALLDVTMPELNGIDVAARIRRECPTTRTMIVSGHVDAAFVRGALAAGALAYLPKDADVGELEQAVHTVMRGERYVTLALASLAQADDAERPSAVAPQLTPRQREVLQLIAEGHGTRAIAERLHVSVKTIETHRAQIMLRLGIRDVASLTRYAIRIGLVSASR